VYQAVSLWASQLAPGVKTLQGFAASTAVPELETEVIELQHAMLNQAAPGWSTRALVTALKQARRRLLRKHKTNPMTRLPPLNP
jgi:hypothetical protein